MSDNLHFIITITAYAGAVIVQCSMLAPKAPIRSSMFPAEN
jgi:hypothetical protein